LPIASVGIPNRQGCFRYVGACLFVTVGHSRPGRGATGSLAAQWVAGGSRSSGGCRHREIKPALTAAGGRACRCDRAGSGVQARRLTGAAAANTRATQVRVRGASNCKAACGCAPRSVRWCWVCQPLPTRRFRDTCLRSWRLYRSGAAWRSPALLCQMSGTLPPINGTPGATKWPSIVCRHATAC
jgi:hypothetical protein